MGPLWRFLRERLRRRGELIPLGFNWSFVVTVDLTMVGCVVIATAQRPVSDLPVSLLAVLVAMAPALLFFLSGIEFTPPFFWLSGMTATAIFLFATATPVGSDFAPLLVVLTTGLVGAMASVLAGTLAAVSALALLGAAAATGRLDTVALYLAFVGIGWLVGFLMRTQQHLMIEQQRAQEALAEHAVADERRRIAREVHDVIAHSLTVTLLHLTGARRSLQEDNDVDDAVDALQQAEQLGRQAMADIRRTVGLLDSGPVKLAPEPGIDDIDGLIQGFTRAGMRVTQHIDGPTGDVSDALGLALYRITQESLSNIAKHAPSCTAAVDLTISQSTANLSVVNKLPASTAPPWPCSTGRGIDGIRQRVELLGGTIDVGPGADLWTVRAELPLDGAGRNGRRPWGCGP